MFVKIGGGRQKDKKRWERGTDSCVRVWFFVLFRVWFYSVVLVLFCFFEY